MTERKISGAQLSLLLFLCSVSAQLSGSMAQGHALSYPLGMALAWLALLPAFLLQRRKGLLPALGRAGKPFVIPVAAILTLFCAAMAARALGGFAFFMTSTVYPTARAGIFILCTAAVCAYAAGTGLEPLARLGLWGAVLAGATLAALAAGLSPSMRLSHLANPLSEGFSPILHGAGRFACSAGELVLFLLLIPRARGKKAGRTAVAWLVLAAASMIAMALLVTAALGPFGESRRFPLHTAAAAAHFSPQGRMDLLYLFFYVCAAFVRTALWLYAGCLCFRRLFPRLRRGICAVICAAGAAGLAFLPWTYAAMDRLFSGWMLLGVVLLPLLLLILPQKRAGREAVK